MRILVLGGTIFVGRHLVEAAIARGHAVTLFNRGRHNPNLFQGLESLCGDRDGGLEALAGQTWDAVIDTCGYFPRVVKASADVLADRCQHYTFISSLSVIADHTISNQDESAPVGSLEDKSIEEITGETYGPLKALCEETVAEAYDDRALIVRPGLIVGPHDPTDRFTYWPARLSGGGEILAPGDPSQPVQFIDARDLAAWILRLIESHKSGTYNATGPAEQLAMGAFLDTCQAKTEGGGTLTWVSESFLLGEAIAPFTEMPLWVPKEWAGFATFNCAKAIGNGLAFRPTAETIADTLAWHQSRPPETKQKAGLSLAREAELLGKWRTRSNPTS